MKMYTNNLLLALLMTSGDVRVLLASLSLVLADSAVSVLGEAVGMNYRGPDQCPISKVGTLLES